MPGSKPPITGSQRILPFNGMDPKEFERLALWLVQREGFENVQHLGAAGSEQGRDIIAWREGVLWAFQCKQVQSFATAKAAQEIKKLLKLPAGETPANYVFIASCQISAEARTKINELFGERLKLHFWAVTELDEKVKKHPDVVEQFFQIAVLPPIPHQIPAPPGDFTGRADELRNLLQAQAEGICISGLRGLGGVGKSALAFKLAEMLSEHYPDGQLFIDMRGTSAQPLTPAQAMAQVIRLWQPEAHLPEGEAELAPIYRSLLHGKRLILLLDNARDAAQVAPLIPPASCFLLVTSRWHFPLPGLKACDLDALSLDEAVKLLISIEPRLAPPSLQGGAGGKFPPSLQGEPGGKFPPSLQGGAGGRLGDPAQTLADLCGCLPLALRTAASALALRPSLPVDEFLDKFRQTQTRLKLTGMQASLQVSYDLLDPAMQAKLRLLSVFPAPFDRPAAAAVCEVDEEAAQEALDALLCASLLEWDAETGFRLHDLVREFVAGQLSAEEQHGAALRHAAHYLEVARQANEMYIQGGEHLLQGLRLFDRHWAHIQAGQAWAAAGAEEEEAAARLCNEYPNAIYLFIDLRLHSEQWIAWLQDALKAASRLGLKEYQGYHLGNLGTAYADLGQVEKAIDYSQQHATIAHEIGDRQGEGNALNNLGLAYADLGQVEKAIGHYQKSLVIKREIGNRRGESNTLGNLGNAYARLGQVEKAIDHYQQALGIDRETGDRRGEGADLGNLGNAYADLGQMEKAIEHHQGALGISREIGDRRGEGADLGNLGAAYADLGQVEKAIEHYEEALVIAREIGDRRNEGAWLGNLGIAYENLGQVDKAIQHYQQQLDIAREIGDRWGEANASWNLGLVYEKNGDLAGAIAAMQVCVDYEREIGHPDAEKDAAYIARLKGGKAGAQGG